MKSRATGQRPARQPIALSSTKVPAKLQQMNGNSSSARVTEFNADLSLGDFVVGDSKDPLIPPAAFTQWRKGGAWEAELYEPELLKSADARTSIRYDGKSRRSSIFVLIITWG